MRPAASGLSPPTRGSPPGRAVRRARPGSIPAHTGKPDEGDDLRLAVTVYPRPHGEAHGGDGDGGGERGLSPPTRGSLHRDRGAALVLGSIPAHTGKPVRQRRRIRSTRVYPRPHGEASLQCCHVPLYTSARNEPPLQPLHQQNAVGVANLLWRLAQKQQAESTGHRTVSPHH